MNLDSQFNHTNYLVSFFDESKTYTLYAQTPEESISIKMLSDLKTCADFYIKMKMRKIWPEGFLPIAVDDKTNQQWLWTGSEWKHYVE